jgi:dipeptidyl aminopeptidase/acylaminoacyl peptidase
MKLLKRLLAAALAGLSLAAAIPALAQATPEIPVETLFRKPEYRSLTFSPDQKFMAALVPVNSRYNLMILDLDKRSATRVTNLPNADVLSFFWANNDRIIFRTGNEAEIGSARGDGGLFAVNKDGSNSRVLVAPIAEKPGQYVLRLTNVLARIKDNNEEVLVSANDRDAETQDIYRMNIFTGRKTLVSFDSPGKVQDWVLDRNNAARVAFTMDMKTGMARFMYRSSDSGPFKALREWDEQLKDVVMPVGFAPDNKSMYVASNIGRDTMAFFRFDPETNTLGELIYGDDRYDVYTLPLLGDRGGGSIIFSGSEEDPGKILGVSYTAGLPKVVWFDDEAKRTQATLDAALPAGNVNTWNPRQRRTLVRSYSSTDPGRFFIFDRDKRTLEDTGISLARWIDPKQMRPMEYVSWNAPDGRKISGYLTLPASYAPGKPVPLILHPHGGPWARDSWGFNREVQFMANRGFAVLQPNFRGSLGYGTAHLKASYKQWGDSMIDDMIAGVEWAVKEGYADKNRLAVYGASYGGYATLMSLVKRPDLFKWGINYVGVSDMFVHQDTQPAQRFGDFGARLAKIINGDQKTDREMFERTSPTRQVSKIQAPVFHAYGGEDVNVDIENGRVIRAAFDRAGKTQEWMFVADEAHGYRLDKNVFEYYKRFDAFMKKHTPKAN